MNGRVTSAWVLTAAAAIVLLAVPSARAQGRGPGGGRPGGGMPGGHPGFGPSPGAAREGGRGNVPFPVVPHTENGNGMRPTVQLGPPGRWWDNSHVVRTIGLRRDQQQRMDTIFKANKSALVESFQTLQREEAKLTAVSRQAQPDKAQLFAAIDAVNQARASLEKVRTQMLLQIRQQMDADQITRLESLGEVQPTETPR